MKDFFKFDDRRTFSLIWFFLSLFLIWLLIRLKDVIVVLVPGIVTLIISVLAMLFTYNEGIHFNYKKEKIVIVQGLMINKINMKDVKYFTINEILKPKKGNITQLFVDPVKNINSPSKYIYNNGKVFNIVFYMKRNKTVEVYYGWLYKTNSAERINNQLDDFKKIKERFMKYKNY